MSWGDVLLIAGGFGAGFLSGTIGIGGGLLFVPTAIVGGITHIREGNVLLTPAVWMGGGGVVGAVIGALVAVEVPGPILARIWGGFLVFSAYRLFMQGFQAASRTP